MPQRRPSEILGLTPRVVQLGNQFVSETFLGPRPGTPLPESIADPLATAWEAGKATGQAFYELNAESSAIEAREAGKPSVADVPGALVRARNVPERSFGDL